MKDAYVRVKDKAKHGYYSAENSPEEYGYIEAGIIPKFSLCSDGVNWFKAQGQWQDRNYEPMAGDIIFFD